MGEKLFDFWASRFVRLALVVKQDGLFDPIAIRFLRPVGVILQTQPLAELVQESFFRWKPASSPGSSLDLQIQHDLI